MIKETDIVRVLHSRGVTVLMVLVMLGGIYWLYYNGVRPEPVANRGLLFGALSNLPLSPEAKLGVTCGASLLATVAMMLINRGFNIFRTVSQLDGTFFIAMLTATPLLLFEGADGMLLGIVLLLCMTLMFTSYGDGHATRKVYTVFVLLSCGAMVHYAYLFYVPVFLTALVQMRIMGWRTLSASLLGLLTPWWIVLGLGIVDIDMVSMPESNGFFALIDGSDALWCLIGFLVMGVMLVAGWCLNFMKMLSYNAQMRAYMGVISLLSLMTLLAIFVDFGDVSVYLPMLYLCAAFQLSHYFANRGRSNTAVAIGCIIAVCWGIYALSVFL